MKGFDTLHVKSATKSHNKFDLSRTHLTTMDFGEIVPLLVEETVPGDKFSIKGNYFSRLAPLAKPTYGKFQFKTMAAFVPYFQIADDAEAWLAGKRTWEGESAYLRYFTVMDFVSFLNNSYVSSAVTPMTGVTTKADNGILYYEDSAGTRVDYATYDYMYGAINNAVVFRKFTTLGKYYIKVLNSLGYAIPQNINLDIMSSGNTWISEVGNMKLNAMPLLCFAKAFNDYMSQSQRYNTSNLTRFLKAVKHNKTTTGYAGQGQIGSEGILTILTSIRPCYENDYFLSAWQKANAPIANQNDSILGMNVPSTGGLTLSDGEDVSEPDYVANYDNGTRLLVEGHTTDYGATIWQRSLDFLKAFDDWVRRNNYAGSRAVQQIYARFGVKTDDYRSNYAHVISTDSIPVQVGDITSQADTEGAQLGDYAGKGIMSGEKGFSFDCKDYGMLFVFGWYSITPMNAYGFSRTVLKNQPFDFYNAEYDGMAAQAISYGELFANPVASGDTHSDNDVFGFTERYNEYRYGRDNITGEFRNFNNKNEMNTWHMGRLLTDVRAAGNMVAQSTSMNTLSPQSSEYNRIFSVTDKSVNHFYLTANFNVSAVRPMLSLNQVPRLGEGDTTISRNGNEIN